MAINTYFKNIADAIREKTGGSALIAPGQMPQAIRDIHTGYRVDLEHVNIVGMQVSATRGMDFRNFVIQIGSFFLADENDNNYVWGNTSNGAWGGLITDRSESATNLFRNNYTGSAKLLVRLDSNGSALKMPSGFIAFLENPVNCTVYKKWKWYTANDGEERDPITFGLILGNYVDNNIITNVYDYGTRSITTNRNALAYEGLIG